MPSKRADFVTWERAAISMVTLLIAMIGFVGHQIGSEVEAMRRTLANLNATLVMIQVDSAAVREIQSANTQRIEDLRARTDKLSDRLREIEKKD